MKRFIVFLITLCFAATGPAASRAGENNQASTPNHWTASVKAEESANYDEALKQLAAFGRDGGDPFLCAMRSGWLSYMKASYSQAEQSYAAASKLQPAAINPLIGLLNVAQASQDAKKIERAAEAVLHLDPVNYQAQMALAGVSFSTRDYRKAASTYRRVLVTYPEDTGAHSGAAWSFYYLGEKSNALAGFRYILSIDPDYSYAQQGYDLASGKNVRSAPYSPPTAGFSQGTR